MRTEDIVNTYMAAPKTKASFIEPMLLLRTESLPEGPNWLTTDDADRLWSVVIQLKPHLND